MRFNLFSQKQVEKASPIEDIYLNAKPSYSKTINDTVLEIHNAFEIAGDLAIKEAQAILNKPKQYDVDKAQKLRNLGFTNVKGVREEFEERSLAIQKKEEIDLINKWTFKYPQYKVILEKDVKRICEKYNLVFGEAEQYKGTIPDKNIEEISSFSIKDEDRSFCKGSYSWKRKNIYSGSRVPKTDYEDNYWVLNHFQSERVGFEICAPISDMDTNGYKQEGYKLVREIPDPIVLYPVPNGAYLIVSKWGECAEENSLTNEKMN